MASSSAQGSDGTVDQPPDKMSDYIRTAAQNYISRRANVLGAQNLVSNGRSVIRPDATVRGDYGAPIYLGRYCRLDEGVIVTPCVVPRSSDPLISSSSSSSSSSPAAAAAAATAPPPGENEKALPVSIGSHTSIGRGTVVRSVSVGSCVLIGSNCVLSSRTKIHDCCVVEDGTILPPDAVVPPFSRVRGNPGRIVGTLPECAGGEIAEDRVRDYLDFVGGLVGGGD
jgi:dynactin-5